VFHSISNHNEPPEAMLVWDLPTRMFHWLLVVLGVFSFVTGKIGGNAMQYHEWSGVAILILLVFRITWGFVGSRASRFSDFVRGPVAVWRYAMSLIRGTSARYFGHNPLGGWSVLAMLLVLALQAGTGLFANDDIMTDGPLSLWVSKQASDRLTGLHKFNRYTLTVLVAIHFLAVMFHLFVKHENLIKPMISGIKHWQGRQTVSRPASNWMAALIAVLAGCLVCFVVY
jgi:cytochrome b